MVRRQLRDPMEVGFVNHLAGAQLALTLGWFLRQDVTLVGLATLEAFRCLAKTLRRGPVGFQLGHRRLSCRTVSRRRFLTLSRHPAVEARRARGGPGGTLARTDRSLVARAIARVVTGRRPVSRPAPE